MVSDILEHPVYTVYMNCCCCCCCHFLFEMSKKFSIAKCEGVKTVTSRPGCNKRLMKLNVIKIFLGTLNAKKDRLNFIDRIHEYLYNIHVLPSL